MEMRSLPRTDVITDDFHLQFHLAFVSGPVRGEDVDTEAVMPG